MEKTNLKFKKQSQKEVNYLVKQFEMKKSADQYKRQATSKTGVINTNSLYKYKLTDDIFKRITTVPDGKNHGLVFHIDWSGSMTHVLLDTIKQTFNLVWFCEKQVFHSEFLHSKMYTSVEHTLMMGMQDSKQVIFTSMIHSKC